VNAPRLLRSRLAAAIALALVVLVLGGFWVGHSVVLLKRDLDSAKQLLLAASKSDAGSVGDRIALLSQAHSKLDAIEKKLASPPLRQVESMPLLGRDMRVVQAMAHGTGETVAAAERLMDALSRADSLVGGYGSIKEISVRLTSLDQAVQNAVTLVVRTTPLVATNRIREEFLAEGSELERRISRGAEAANLVAAMYGPKGATRYLMAFQNPAELRGTGGIIGLYGILESAPSGPRLRDVESTEALRRRLSKRVALPPDLAGSYEPFGFDGDWRQVNVPPDLPTVGRVILGLYRPSHGRKLDGLIVIDPLAAAEILRVAGPVVVAGQRLDADDLPKATMVDAYARYEKNPLARKRFLAAAARQTVQRMAGVAVERPIESAHALGAAIRGRHLQIYSSNQNTEEVLRQLGAAGSTAGPAFGDYLLPIGINEAGNKLDVFLDRRIRYDVQIQPDGGAMVEASVTLHNRAPAIGLPRAIIGPYDRRFKAGENRQFQELYVAEEYGLMNATVDGRRIAAYAIRDSNGLMLGRELSVHSGQSSTIDYRLKRTAAVQVEGERIKYRLLIRPQPRARADFLAISISAPAGWQFVKMPSGFRSSDRVASWSGPLEQEQNLDFEMERTDS
jgi:Protein of unknown function (DUF4012)